MYLFGALGQNPQKVANYHSLHQARGPWRSPYQAAPRLNKKGALRPPPWHRDSPRAPSSGKYSLPQWGILILLIEAMRSTPCGRVGWRWLPSKSTIASPSFLPILGARETSASSHTKDNKKRSHTIPTFPWEMAECAFSRQGSSSLTSISIRASQTIYFMLSQTFDLIY